MPSIRRNLLGYLLLLLALALGGVGLLVDRFAVAAMQAREEAETKRLEEAYKTREKEALVKFDAELLSEAQLLARELVRARLFTPPILGRGTIGAAVRPTDEEVKEYHTRAAALLVGVGPTSSLGTVLPARAMIETTPRPFVGPPAPGSPRPPDARALSLLWQAFEVPRVVGRVEDALERTFEEDEPAHLGEFQVHFVVSDPAYHVRSVAVVRSAGLDHDLPLNIDALDRDPKFEYRHDEVSFPDAGDLRRVVLRITSPGRGPWGLWLLPPVTVPAATLASRQPPARLSELQNRLYVQYTRPMSELADRLAQDREDRNEQLARMQDGTRHELALLRTRLALIAGGTFVALVLGGWLIVARGLAPVHKLSDAVSRVSEKDFRLPIRDDEMSRELLPIHFRLTQTLDLLHRAFAREKQSVADISHELRTPIAALLATLDVALRKPRTPDQYRNTLEDCRAITKQLSQLVERIMTLANLDAGTARTTQVGADAADVAVNCAAVIRPLADAHGLTLDVRTDEPLELDTDPDKLREVLINLLHNAIEYNRPGGTVELTGRRENGHVRLEVRDTGIGMTPEVREKIFERFFRADPSRQTTGVHAGLGLAIVKEYVERLGGTIAVESEPGSGSLFRLDLPAADSPRSDEPAEPTPPAPPAGPARQAPRPAVPTRS